MASVFPLLAVSALMGALLAPLAIAWRRTGASPLVATGFAIILLVISGYHTGWIAAPVLPKLDFPELAQPSLSDAQCTELVDLLERNGVIIDREPPRLVVVGSAWSALPAEGQAAIAYCVQRDWPEDGTTADIDIQTR